MARDNHLKEERRQGMRYNDTKREINIETLPKGIYNLKIEKTLFILEVCY